MKLEIKHLAPYLPYGLKISQYREDIKLTWDSEMTRLSSDTITVLSEKFPYLSRLSYYEAKPILRTLYGFDLRFFYGYPNREMFYEDVKNKTISVKIWNELLEGHFDVFGLIEKGLAIDINTLK